MSGTPGDLVTVELRDFPMAVYSRAEEHSDGLMREFSLIATSEASDAVPRRLLDLAAHLEQQFGDYTAGYDQEIEAARSRGDDFVTLRLQVPRGARDAALELAETLAQADEYCRSGDLLSLVPPPDVLRFRNWYIEQFVGQIDGRPPVPWTDHIGATEPADAEH